jgi:hypothetical protein
MRARILVFAAVVAIALGLNLARLSLSVAQEGEDTLRARLATATSALKGQMELLDARLSPRAVAQVPDLIDVTRAPADPTQPLGNPDERALRAAASALSPEPDLLAVVNPQGAIVSRRSKPALPLEDPARLPMSRTASGGGDNPAPVFASFDGAVYRFGAARVPGNAAAAVVGSLIDDRFAQQLKSQLDADVTLLQGGKVIASSLSQGEDRANVARWAAAPTPGYGMLRVSLPLVGTQLSGKLPRGAGRYAVRGALVSLDSGVQAALTVPASPYFAWLARYQAFYVVALALFILFSLVWALLARAPAPVAQAAQQQPEPSPRPARSSPPSLLGTDVGEPRTEPPPKGDVPWTPPHEDRPSPPPAPMEALDPELPAAPPAKMPPPAPSESPTWAADPFTPTPGQFTHSEPEPEMVSPEDVGLVEAVPSPPPPPPEEERKSAHPNGDAAKGDFSFAGLLDEAHSHPPPAAEPPPPLAQHFPDTTAPGRPSAELLAEARGEHGAGPASPQFPGDEPTRVEAVSAALIDKLRERDDEPAAPPPQQGWGSLVGDENDRTMESGPPVMPPPEPRHARAEPPPGAGVTMQDFSLPEMSADEQDPDETHWRETFDKFRELKVQLGEPADKISFEKFAAKLKKNRADLLAKHNCKGVRFSVYEKDGRAAIKASAIR